MFINIFLNLKQKFTYLFVKEHLFYSEFNFKILNSTQFMEFYFEKSKHHLKFKSITNKNPTVEHINSLV